MCSLRSASKVFNFIDDVLIVLFLKLCLMFSAITFKFRSFKMIKKFLKS